MKKTFKLFGFIALSMTLAVACGNANNTPAEEEVVAEETVEATEQVVEEVAAPATQTQATCDEKKDEQNIVAKDEATANKEQMVEQGKAKLENKLNGVAQEVKSETEKQVEQGKAKLEAKAKGGFTAAN